MRVYSRRLSMAKSSSADDEQVPRDLYFPVEGVRFQDLHDWKHETPKTKRSTMNIHCSNRRTGTLVKVNEKMIALFRLEDKVYAMDEKCPHQGGPLHLGDIESLGMWVKTPCVVCPWHRWTFNLETGDIRKPATGVKLELYPVRILEDGTLMIGFDNFDLKYFDGCVEF